MFSSKLQLKGNNPFVNYCCFEFSLTVTTSRSQWKWIYLTLIPRNIGPSFDKGLCIYGKMWDQSITSSTIWGNIQNRTNFWEWISAWQWMDDEFMSHNNLIHIGKSCHHPLTTLEKGLKTFMEMVVIFLKLFAYLKSALTVTRVKYWQYPHHLIYKIIWVVPSLPSLIHVLLPKDTHWILLI